MSSVSSGARRHTRSQIDYPAESGPRDEFPIGSAMVERVADRIARSDDTRLGRADVEAKARAIALISLQLAYSVFGPMLRDGVGVDPPDRADVDALLRTVYDQIALRDAEARGGTE